MKKIKFLITLLDILSKFVELHNRINYQIDILKPWKKDEYYNDFTLDKMNRWKNIMDGIEKEYLNIIDVKKFIKKYYSKN